MPSYRPVSRSASEDALGKQIDHEAAAHEKRNWVRLTSMCNNKCTFCLDALAHNETMGSEEEIRQRIYEGRKNGATRLILSGGEPTIHPSFIKFVKYGQLAGYRRIQTVTNGRMFSYPEFLTRALEAGLHEITFSIHGADAKVHDALVGVKGAFDEEVEGLRRALADGRPIVNIDVCLNRGNIRRLPELLDRFIAMGVREFDLLHIIPFGNAWDRANRDALVYDIDEAMPYIQAALAYSERPDIHIWFNRFPPPYLEHYEHLIQDPYKLVDEVRGRFEEYELWITRRMPLSCREPDRCPRCYLQNVCDTLEQTMDRVHDDGFDAFRVRAGGETVPAPADYGRLWICAGDAAAARRLAGTGDERLILELESYDGFVEALQTAAGFAGRVERVIVEKPSELDALLAAPFDFEVQCRLTTANAGHVMATYAAGHPRLSLTVPNYELASEAATRIPNLEEFFGRYTAAIPVENVPACILGRAPRPRLRVLDSSVLRSEHAPKPTLRPGDTGGRASLLAAVDQLTTGNPAAHGMLLIGPLAKLQPKVTKGPLDAFGFVREYIRDGYYTRSRRCESCAVETDCPGLHVNTVRAYGYRWLKPVSVEETVPDRPAFPAA